MEDISILFWHHDDQLEYSVVEIELSIPLYPTVYIGKGRKGNHLIQA